MRTDVKVGVLVGVLIVAGAVIYVSTKDKPVDSPPTVPDTAVTTPADSVPGAAAGRTDADSSVETSPDSAVSEPEPKMEPEPPVNPEPVQIIPDPQPIPEPEPLVVKEPEPKLEPLVNPPASPQDVVVSEPANTEPWYYVVKRGDTLFRIAEQYYGEGNGRYWKVIYDTNKELIGDADRLEVGWILNIPRPEDVAGALD